MNYKSTRNSKISVKSATAIKNGLSADGGLFVPESLPKLDMNFIFELSKLNYQGRAISILGKFLDDFSEQELSECVKKAYTQEKFGSAEIAPIIKIDKKAYMLELWHGPTCAFKDMALQLLPHLLTHSIAKTGDLRQVVILVATSGDTGKAALEGFRDIKGTKILVFYPEQGVSAIQKLQMTTQDGENVGVCAIKGNFDDAQTGVKKIFSDLAIAEKLDKNGYMFSSANSINWGRLVPQIVYYFSAYCDLIAKNEIKSGEKINVVVPTGNFGNILAAYYAKSMGLPIHKLICASNSNNVLTDFIKTGIYDRNRDFYTTISPSMDILISSNLERLLFDLCGGDDTKTQKWMNELSQKGKYEVDEETKKLINENLFGGFCDGTETKKTIREVFLKYNYLCDPHTAVAINVYQKYINETGDNIPTVIASTASPYKFANDVVASIGSDMNGSDFEMLDILSNLSKTEPPIQLQSLKNKKVRFNNCCTIENMRQEVFNMLKI
jgi:threonine synthase